MAKFGAQKTIMKVSTSLVQTPHHNLQAKVLFEAKTNYCSKFAFKAINEKQNDLKQQKYVQHLACVYGRSI